LSVVPELETLEMVAFELHVTTIRVAPVVLIALEVTVELTVEVPDELLTKAIPAAASTGSIRMVHSIENRSSLFISCASPQSQSPR